MIKDNKMPKPNHKKFKRMDPEMIKKILSLPKPTGRKIFERVNYRLCLQKDNILKQAFGEKLFTKKEYEEKYKDMFYDIYGSDSFVQYINAVMNAKVDYFVTTNERMLRRRKELEQRFKLKIVSSKEVLDEDGK